MSARASISQFLTRFDAPRFVPAQREDSSNATNETRDAAIARALETARAEGEAFGRAAARRDYEDGLVQNEEIFRNRLAEARAHWSHEESERLAALFETRLESFAAELSGCLTAMLTPLIGGCAADRMMRSLLERLDRLMSGAEPATINIRGPADLVAALRSRCEARGLIAHFEISDSVDVAVRCGTTLIETRLSAWADELNAAMRAE